MYTPDGYPKKLSRSATVCFLDAVVFDVDIVIRKSKLIVTITAALVQYLNCSTGYVVCWLEQGTHYK